MTEATKLQSDVPFVRRVLIAVVIGALVLAVWLLSEILLLIFGSILVAVMLRALASPLIRIGLGERWALTLGGLLVLLVLAGAAFLFGSELLQQMRGLSDRLSAAATTLASQLQVGSIAELLKGENPASSLSTVVARLFAWSSTLLGVLAGLLLVIFGGIYLAADPQTYRNGMLKLIPAALQSNVDAALGDANEALRHWLGAQLAAMVLVGTLTGVGLSLIGLPSSVALGFIAGVAEFVPIVGPLIGAVPALLVAGAQDWQTVLWTLGIIVGVQQVESNLITPLVIGRTVAVAPAVALFTIVAMGVLFGPLGLLFGFPLAIVLDVAVRRLYVMDTLGRPVEILGRPAKAS